MADNRTKTDQYQLRFPPGLRDQIKLAADENSRSMNAEIVYRLAEFDNLRNDLLEVTANLEKRENDLFIERSAIRNLRAAEAEHHKQTLLEIGEKYDELKAQSAYLESLKAELLDLSKERYEIDSDRDKLIAEQSKIIDRLSRSEKQGKSIMRRFLKVIEDAASGDSSAFEKLIIELREKGLSVKRSQSSSESGEE